MQDLIRPGPLLDYGFSPEEYRKKSTLNTPAKTAKLMWGFYQPEYA